MAFNLQDYETVADRIARFYKDNKEGRIHTDIVQNENNVIVVQARVYKDSTDNIWATGFAEEVRGKGMVNTTSALENCETSAVGRALANAGYSGSKQRASREEMEKVERHNRINETQTMPPITVEQDDIEPVYNTTVKQDFSGSASPAQIAKIHAMLAARGITTDEKKHIAIERYTGKNSFTKLTKNDASDIIDDLTARQGENNGQE